jgi:hypothetical protein
MPGDALFDLRKMTEELPGSEDARRIDPKELFDDGHASQWLG